MGPTTWIVWRWRCQAPQLGNVHIEQKAIGAGRPQVPVAAHSEPTTVHAREPTAMHARGPRVGHAEQKRADATRQKASSLGQLA